MIARFARAVAFARHIPPKKLLWRARLTLQRRLALRRPPSLAGPTPPRAAYPPQGLFAPRLGLARRGDGGWRFTFVGRAIDAGDPIDWQTPSRDPRDQLWRMNLHYFEYLEGLDRAGGIDLIRQWIAANPAYAPGYWHDSWNSYALSLRVVCWMQFLVRTAAADDMPDDDVPDIVASLAEQVRFLEANLERDLGGNHLVKNIKALIWASSFFAGAQAGRWRTLAMTHLACALETQLLPDGVHYERSPSYHAQVLADLIEIRHAIGGGVAPLSQAIARMARAVVDLSHPDGTPALFNDAGLHMAYPPAECAALANAWPTVEVIAGEPVFAYRSAGYYGAHLPGLSIIADMGRIGADDLPAHAHGDVGTFELSIDGLRFIVDQGVYEYVAGAARDRSRAAASHAALAIDGAEQADFFGAFRVGRRPNVTVGRWEPRADGFVLEGRHDGYARLPGGPMASRTFDVSPDVVRIEDRLSARVTGTVSVGLLLHPECAVMIDAQVARVSRGGSVIEIVGSGTITDEAAVWWPDMGVEVPTRRLRLTWPSGSDEGAFEIRRLRAAWSGHR